MPGLMLRKENFQDAAWSFLFSLFLGILPTWALFGALKLYREPISMPLFTQNGEFALYSASMMSAIMYISVKNYLPLFYRETLRKRKLPFVIKATLPFQVAAMLFALVIILISTVFFSLVIIAKFPGVNGLTPDLGFLTATTVVLFIAASILSFFITVLDNAASANYTDTDYRKDMKVDEDKLASALDELLEEEHHD